MFLHEFYVSISYMEYDSERKAIEVQKKIFFGDFYIYYDELKDFLRTYIWKYLRPFYKGLKEKTHKYNSEKNYLLLGGEYEWPIYLSKRKIN